MARDERAGHISLSTFSRAPVAIAGLLIALFGLVCFVAPGWSADHFPWRVSDFVAMTIGAWCVGTAVFAALAASDGRPGHVYPTLIYLGSFGIAELAVVVGHRHALRTDVALTVPYLVCLSAVTVAGAVGLVEAVRYRAWAPRTGDDATAPGWLRGVAAGFVLLVAAISAVALAAPSGSLRDSRVFPQPASPFTFRAFGAFYLALVIGTLPLVRERRAPGFVLFLWGGVALLVPIAVAALVYLHTFDLDRRPTRVLYLAVILGILAGALAILTLLRRVRER